MIEHIAALYLVDQNNSDLLSRMNYLGDYIFAFDDIKYKDVIARKLEIMKWRTRWRFKFFVYVHPNMDISSPIKRIKYLYSQKCLPYIMRDKDCWGSPYQKLYTDLACWCNQPHLFKNIPFKEFLEKRHPKDFKRNKQGIELWNQYI